MSSRAHWCRRCENQHCYSRTGAGGARISTVSRTGARTSTVTVALVPAVREPVLLQSHWCENQHCYSRTGARTSTIAEQYWPLPWDRQAVTVTLRAALTTKARNQCETGSNGYAREKTKSCGGAEMANRPSTTI